MNMTSPTCKFLRSYTGIWQGAQKPPPPLCALVSALRNAIDQEILRDFHPPLLPLTDCLLLKFYPPRLSGLAFIGLRDWRYITCLAKLPHHGCALFLPFLPVIINPHAGLKRSGSSSHPPFSLDTLLLFLPWGGGL